VWTKVFHNLCLGLDRLGFEYFANLPFRELKSDDRVGVLGLRLTKPHRSWNCSMTHSSEWPTLCQDYPAKSYLQHSAWANGIYRPYFGDRCAIWPVGIDTDAWLPNAADSPRGFIMENLTLRRCAARFLSFFG
jgi:hypothetical protein